MPVGATKEHYTFTEPSQGFYFRGFTCFTV